MNTILVIDKDLARYKKESAEWQKQGFKNIRVNTMQEGIEKLITKSDYLFVAINADNIDYLPQLLIMRETTNSPIFIIGSIFTIDLEYDALKNGANSYMEWRETPEDNVESVLMVLDDYTRQRYKKSLKVLFCGEIMLVLEYRKVFINDKPLELSKREFEIINKLMINRGRVLSYKKILRYVYMSQYDEKSLAILRNAIKRLRKKIKGLTPLDYIKTESDVGYYISP